MQASGQFGGNGGGPFDFVRPTLSLVGVRGKAGASIDQIQFLFVDVNTGQFAETPRWGGNGGGHFEWQAPIGEWID